MEEGKANEAPRQRRMRMRLIAATVALVVVVVAIGAVVYRIESATTRDPLKQPFSSSSIWNLPIGVDAHLIPASIKISTSRSIIPDSDILVLRPTAPLWNVYMNTDDWTGRSRCEPEGKMLFSAPIPADFVVAGAHPGYTPNSAAAILDADGHTLIQGQPFARCLPGGTPTIHYFDKKEDLFGVGISGYHGGSCLSGIGGTLRLGELVPGGMIPHALKVGLFEKENYFYDNATKGFRWPASGADATAPMTYQGTNPAVRMGSLLVLPQGIGINALGFETEAAKILAKALRDYGAYVVDSANWSGYNLSVEYSPDGYVVDEFQKVWGFSMAPLDKNNAWSRDIDRIMSKLNVVDNWDASLYQAVVASHGGQGVGGGAPLVPWAPALPKQTPTPMDIPAVLDASSAILMTGGAAARESRLRPEHDSSSFQSSDGSAQGRI